jgi:SAM-dependent methyltransferase
MRFVGSIADRKYLDPDVPISRVDYSDYLTNIGNRKGIRVLEIGSREVTGKSDARKRFSNAEYVGFDIYPGPNVNVVGDAHKLSQYFQSQTFDVIYSSAVFEHFAMPWVVATEIAKVLKIGGIVSVRTHFSYGSHERPWHFFQFSDMALRVLFSPALGFECIEAGVSNPMVGRFSALAQNDLRFMPVRGLYCGSEFLGRKIKDVEHFNWNDINLEEVVGGTKYPAPLTQGT